MTKLSLYTNAFDVKSTKQIDMQIFLDNIRDGQWQDEVIKYRRAKDRATKDRVKKKLPNVTISGLFSSRRDDAIIEHSEFLCMDLDGYDPMETKSILAPDEYVYSLFTSCGGKGLAAVFRITSSKHREAFYAISQYLLDTYSIVVDPTAVNPSRSRFVSWDPDIYVNEKAKKFTKYLPKKKTIHKTKKIVFVQNDFEAIIQQLENRHVDITHEYMDWLRIGFGLADKFGEDGRSYYHQISQISNKYKANICDRQYTNCLKAKGSGVTIGTFYYLAKQAGIDTYSVNTKEIIQIAASQKRTGGMAELDIIKNLKDLSDFDHDLIDQVVPQVDKEMQLDDISDIEKIENDLRVNYTFRRNVIKRKIEINKGNVWVELERPTINTIWCKLARFYPKLGVNILENIIDTENTPDFNPLLDFINRHNHLKPEGLIDQLSDTIDSKVGLSNEHKRTFIKKWLVGMMSSIHGKHSPLMLVLVGEKLGTGKTQWFRRLLPDALKSEYYAESTLDRGNDDMALMAEKLIIMNDEFGGKTSREVEKMKSLLSRQSFHMRLAYGRGNKNYNRLAVLAGTSNEYGILNDPAGNRRIIPIHVNHIDHDGYNSINKTELFIEAFHLWKSGFEWELTKDEIKLMSNDSDEFKATSMEEELFSKYFEVPKYENDGRMFKVSWIKEHIDKMSYQKINLNKLGAFLKNHLGKKSKWREDSKQHFGYRLIQIDNSNIYPSADDEIFEEENTLIPENIPQSVQSGINFENDTYSDFNPECPF